jgi:hypothetical protein
VSTLSGIATPDGIEVEYFKLGTAGAPVSISASAGPGFIPAATTAVNAPEQRKSRFVHIGEFSVGEPLLINRLWRDHIDITQSRGSLAGRRRMVFPASADKLAGYQFGLGCDAEEPAVAIIPEVQIEPHIASDESRRQVQELRASKELLLEPSRVSLIA